MTKRTVVRVYSTRKAAEKAISQSTKKGWNVEKFEVHDLQRGWNPLKTCCLGVIFLPLALFGKRKARYEYIVTFSWGE